MTGPNDQERRKHPRMAGNIPLKICSEDFDIVTETANLSCAGAYCRVNKNLEPMTRLKIHLLLPLKKRSKVVTKKVSCQGVIVRSEAAKEANYFNVAIYFNDIDQRDLTNLSDYINSMLENRKEEKAQASP